MPTFGLYHLLFLLQAALWTLALSALAFFVAVAVLIKSGAK